MKTGKNITQCLGVRDAWKWIRHNKWKELGFSCSSSFFCSVVNEVNKELAQALLDNHIVELPFQMGCIQMVTRESIVKYKDGKVISNHPVAWRQTLDYWNSDNKARREKKVLRKLVASRRYVIYSKKRASFRNKAIYSFRPNRGLARRVVSS